MSDRIGTVKQGRMSYSAKVIAESSNPSNMDRMPDPDAYGIIHGCCGDTMEIYLRLNGDRIEEATFMTDGRESAIACASVLSKCANQNSARAIAGRGRQDQAGRPGFCPGWLACCEGSLCPSDGEHAAAGH